MQGASIAKISAPSSTDLLTQQAIAAVNGQVMPGAIGGVGSGFMPSDTFYNGNAGLFGVAGGTMSTLDAVTSAASVDTLAASRAASTYSAATLLNGLGMGIPAAPTQLAGDAFRASLADPRPGVQVAGDFWPPMGGNYTRTDEAEMTGASGQRDWASQSKIDLFLQGVANGLNGIMWGGGMPPPTSPALALVGPSAIGLARAVTGLVPRNAIFNSGNEDHSSSVSSSAKTEFKEFNQAQKAAMEWLGARGFKAEQPTLAKFGDGAGKPIGMKSSDGRVGFRIEYDERSGAHINVFAGKEKGPHFTFEGSQSTVDQIVRQYRK
ncbi:hypothetical protein [Burkholderia sp. BCC1977]|uniref:hypothetical protein n=1 Tax=Burkholderia sp. BCC1977 TaxID=2817440 RepID=UPI002ABDCF02|nr:hypothetical protein [Burkholderia sp. BCC1977]